MRTESIEQQGYRAFLARAEEFFQAMQTLLDLEEHYHAAALLGIHAVIAMSDALTVSVLGQRSRSEKHTDAAKLLEQACNQRQINKKGVHHFSGILALKSDIAYGKRFSPRQLQDVQKVHNRTEKFFSWAYQHFDALNPEGSEDL